MINKKTFQTEVENITVNNRVGGKLPSKTGKENPQCNKETLIPGSTLIEVRRFFRHRSLHQFHEILPQKKPLAKKTTAQRKMNQSFFYCETFSRWKWKKVQLFPHFSAPCLCWTRFVEEFLPKKKCVIIEGPHGRHTTRKKLRSMSEWREKT